MNPDDKEKNLRQEIHQKTVGYIVAALGLVAGLAWNDAIKATIEYFYKVDGGGLWVRFLYAIIITIVIVVVSYYITKIASRK